MEPTADDAPIDERDLELALLRKGVSALAEGRETCHDCGRTPLAGEQVHLYGSGPAHMVVCELCRMLRPAAPDATHPVHHSEHGLTVRRLAGPPSGASVAPGVSRRPRAA